MTLSAAIRIHAGINDNTTSKDNRLNNDLAPITTDSIETILQAGSQNEFMPERLKIPIFTATIIEQIMYGRHPTSKMKNRFGKNNHDIMLR
jgi:hypothetical protein